MAISTYTELQAAIPNWLGGRADLTLRGFSGNGGGIIKLDTEQRRHGAHAHRHGALHGLTAPLEKAGCVGKGERACGGKG